MIEENHEKTSVRLVDTGIWTRDLPNTSLVRYHGAISLGGWGFPQCINFIISLSKFNLPLIGYFYVTHAARVLQSHDLSGEGIKQWITDILFWPHKDMEGLRDSTNMKDNTHPFIRTRRIWNDDYGGQMIFGNLVGLKFPDICLTGEEKPRKNLTQETCPDRGSNLGPLRDKRACYHLLHSGGRINFIISKILSWDLYVKCTENSIERLGFCSHSFLCTSYVLHS